MGFDDFGFDIPPKGFMRFDLIICSECKTKHVAPEGQDNAYNCRKCGKDLMHEKSKQYDVLEEQVATFLKKFYKGATKEARSE